MQAPKILAETEKRISIERIILFFLQIRNREEKAKEIQEKCKKIFRNCLTSASICLQEIQVEQYFVVQFPYA